MPNWKELAESKREELIKDVMELVAVESVREDDKATDDAPLGPGPKNGLLKTLEFFDRDGFENQNMKNIVGFLEYKTENSDDDYVAILGHVDVMPAGDGWDTDAFTPVIKDNRIYGRGSSDDKGPTLAAYYGLKIVRELGLPLKHKIRFLIGTDEENDWTGMNYYFANQPEPIFGFSPDADFPIINGEKGLGQFVAKFSGSNDGDVVLEEFDSGIRTNMVPGKAKAVISGSNLSEIQSEFDGHLGQIEGVSGMSELADDQLVLRLVGKQAHGAFPEKGINAGTYLANFLKKFDFNKDAKEFLEFVGEKSHLDTEGKKIGIDSEDDVMGKLSYNIGIIKYVNNAEGMINVNIRYPKSTDAQTIMAGLNQSVKNWGITFGELGHNQTPHYVAPSDPVVKTLLDIYGEQTGLEAHDQVIGGGTYGRLMKRGVAYGALFPDSIDTMHQANEFMSIDDLMRATAIYAQAIYELANID